MIRASVIVLMGILAAPSGARQAPVPDSTGVSVSRTANAPQRVYLRVSRVEQLAGYVEMEDADVIVVRDLEQAVHSYPKARVAQIVRLVEPTPGQRGKVVLLNGQVIEGVIVADEFEQVVVSIEGVQTRFRRESVSHVVLEPTVLERYQEFKAQLGPGSHAAHLELCGWLFEQREYELARTELTELIKEHDTPEAQALLVKVNAQLSLIEQTRQRAEAPPDSPNSNPIEPPAAAGAAPEGELPSRILTSDDVNVIRVYEIDFDHPPRVAVKADTIRELLEKYGTDKRIPASQTERTALYRAEPLDVVRLMFELRARDLYPQVQVLSEPHALNLFKQRVHDAWLINSCATTDCHGGPNAGRFFLHRKDYKDERVRMTNLLILERLQLDPEWPLINYEKPEDSLLLQYAIPREAARKPHPRAKKFKPAITMGNERLFDEAVRWIEAMMQPRPSYPIEFEPPMLGGSEPVEDQSPPAIEEPVVDDDFANEPNSEPVPR